MEDGEQRGASASPINSILPTGEFSNSTVELNKKRKLQYDLDNSSLPLSKHKFRDRLRETDHSACEDSEHMGNSFKEIMAQGIRYSSEELGESDKDSNSISEDYDTTMTLDLDDGDTETSVNAFPQNLPSTSSNSSKNSTHGSTINPFCVQYVNGASNEIKDDVDDVQQPDQANKGMEGHHVGFEACVDCIISELPDPGTEDLLYSNDVAPNAFLVSPGKGTLGQDARNHVRKPTIDQEFEQYFSMIML